MWMSLAFVYRAMIWPDYDKNKDLREAMTYAYKDELGHEYQLDSGLTYE